MNDLTAKMLPLTQEKFEKMFASGANTLINGLWGWDNLPPTVCHFLASSFPPCLPTDHTHFLHHQP